MKKCVYFFIFLVLALWLTSCEYFLYQIPQEESTPAPEQTPVPSPAGTSTETPAPDPTAVPDETPGPTGAPVITNDPGVTPDPSTTDDPGATPLPTDDPTAEITAAPTETPVPTGISGGIIADHTIVNRIRFDQVPEEAIENAKSLLHVAYDHTSHGSQISEGMAGLITFKEGLGGTPGLYDYYDTYPGNGLDFDDYFSDVSDLGYYPDWVYATREYLGWDCEIPGDYSAGSPNYSSTCNVVVWSWCTLQATEIDIVNYLSAMDQLRVDYPEVTFVYMTGHSDGTGETGDVHYWNNYIRAHCIDNNLILYDFYDIELYDPDGNYFGDKRVTDGCYYDNEPPYDSGTLDGNWAIEWQAAHTQNIDWYDCYSAHSLPVNANMKAYAFWWLLARIAGWDGV